jgi:capsular exopolysaccharide synthesis family protein
VLRRIPLDTPGSNGAPSAALDVIPAGAVPPNPAELIESNGMAQLIEELQTKYDLVIVDTPPTSVVSDAIPLMGRVDGVVIVTRMGKSTRESSRHLSEQLRNLNAPVLGVVANGVRAGERPEYGYYAADSAQPSETAGVGG